MYESFVRTVTEIYEIMYEVVTDVGIIRDDNLCIKVESGR